MSYPQVVPTATQRAILAAITGAGGGLDGAKLHAFQNPVTPTNAIVLADLTECDFDGYAASAAITWGAILNETDGTVYAPGGGIEFAATGSTTPNTVYGVYLTDSAGTTLLAVWLLPDPVGIAGIGDGFVWLLSYGYSGQ
jgi:hypothetical protein